MKPDYSKPLNELELLGLHAVFKSLPTFNNEGFIRSRDLRAMYAGMGFQHTEDQFAEYLDFAKRHFGGIITMKDYIDFSVAIHDFTKFGRTAAATYDKDGDGYINMEEFEDCMKLLKGHIPSLREVQVQYSTFVEEADTNKDAKVSVDELGVWLKNLHLKYLDK